MSDAQQLMLGDFAPQLKKSLSQFHTPLSLAHKMVTWAGIRPGDKVLEPSAGGGNIVRAAMEAGAVVTAIEIDEEWVKYLREQFGEKLEVIHENFTDSRFLRFWDIAIANPPLTKGIAGAHIKHMLNFAPRVVSIIRGQDLHGVGRYDELWSRCDIARIAYLVTRPVYSGRGGEIETLIVDVYRKGLYDGPQTIEHWAGGWS